MTAAGGVSSLALSTITGPGTLIASLMSQLTQTVFDNGLKSGTLGQAKGRYQELAADYAKSVLQALSDVETALTTDSLSAEQQAQVRSQLGSLYGAGLAVSFSETPALIGGLRIQVGSDLYDGSVKTRLEKLEESF